MRIILSCLSLFLTIATGCKDKVATQDNATVNDTVKEANSNNGRDIYCSIPPSPTNNTEALYAEEVSQNTMAEKAFCNLAAGKAENRDVKSFASKIAFENDKVNDPFIQITIKKRILVLDGLWPKLEQDLKTLEKESTAFDEVFLKTMIRNYQRSVSTYEGYLSKLDDVEFKRDALNLLAIKKGHLAEARHLLDQVD
jgi:predicted outer membrane protein